jgi:hypothetical protein
VLLDDDEEEALTKEVTIASRALMREDNSSTVEEVTAGAEELEDAELVIEQRNVNFCCLCLKRNTRKRERRFL